MEHLFDIIVGVLVGGYFVALGLGAKVQPEKLRGNKVFVVFGLLFMMGGPALLVLQKNFSDIPLGMTSQQIVDKIKSEMQLPATLDAKTRLDAVEAGDGRVIFRYTLEAASMAEFKEMVEKLRVYMKKEGCSTTSNKKMLVSGIALEFHYAMLSGPGAEPIVLTPKGCGY